MRWVARALAGTASIRGCGGASDGFPRGWDGLVPVDVAADGGAWLLIVALVGAVLGACALRLLACCVARLLRARRERRVVRAWSGPSPAIRRGGTSPPSVIARLRAGLHVFRNASAHHRGRARGTPSPREIALLVAEVATRLRAGAPASSAWGQALARIGVGSTGSIDDVYPPVLDQWAREPSRWRALLTGGRSPEVAAARSSAASVIVACRFSHSLGAPLADVLDAIGDAIDDAQAVEEARRVASAGPLMSARVLAALPLVGVVAALTLGASPWSFYTGGGPGSACAVSGLAAWGVGIASCRRILARCRSADAGVGARVVVARVVVARVHPFAPTAREATRHSRATWSPRPWPAALQSRARLTHSPTPARTKPCRGPPPPCAWGPPGRRPGRTHPPGPRPCAMRSRPRGPPAPRPMECSHAAPPGNDARDSSTRARKPKNSPCASSVPSECSSCPRSSSSASRPSSPTS